LSKVVSLLLLLLLIIRFLGEGGFGYFEFGREINKIKPQTYFSNSNSPKIINLSRNLLSIIELNVLVGFVKLLFVLIKRGLLII
jgi:Leucine-rich repeat (LRR) protein